jgi:LPS O-antigen subunit length determinant protein (WzzB/FepE family)
MLLVLLVIAIIGLMGGVACFLCRQSKNQSSGSAPNLDDLTMEVGDDVIAASVATPAAENAEASFPHPDEIKNRDHMAPSNTRAEVKITNSQDEDEEDATNEII